VSPLASEILGEEIISRYGQRMPILFKFLDANRTLSIQCHPYKELAEELHARDPENYPDPYNKPEAFVAFTDEGFESMAYIRPIKEFIKVMEEYRPGISARYASEVQEAGFVPADFVREELRPILESGDLALIDEVMPRVINLYKAGKGQVLLSSDGDINSLRHGFIAEIEANSDNTIRVAHTKKPRDMPNFLRAANFAPGRKPMIEFQPTENPQVQNCVTTDVFALDLINLAQEEEITLKSRKSFHLLIAYSGSVKVTGPDGRQDAFFL